MLLHNFRHISDPHTAYENIKRLRPGSAMLVRNGQVEKCWRYWTPEASEPDSSPQRLRALLESAVERRMVADVPVGALLSGGVDSSAIVQLMSRLSRSPIPTFAFGFDRDDEDIRRARAMAKEIGTEHHEFFFDGKHQLDLFGHILRTHGEPIMLLPLIHTVELCRAIRDSGIKVVMTGHGADELFYGYTGHLRTARLSTLLSRAGLLRRLGPILSGRTGVKAIDLLVAAPGQRKATYYRAVARGLWGESLHPEMTKRIGNYPAEELSYWGELTPSGEYIDESNFVALMVENTHSVITAGDLPAMMASVEMRSPFLDEEIVRFALSCPWRAKLPNLKDTKLLKHILKAAVSDLVPEELLFAPKRGFGMGIQEDMVLRGPWREQGNELFAHPLDADGLFDPGKLRGLWRRFLANERGVPASYMAKLLSIQLWLRQAIH